MSTTRAAVLIVVTLVVAVVIIIIGSRADALDSAPEPGSTVCVDDAGSPGFLTPDGCWTIERYNERYSVEALEQTESQALPGRSVADVYNLHGRDADPFLPAADRPRVFMGQAEPTVAELIARIPWVWF